MLKNRHGGLRFFLPVISFSLLQLFFAGNVIAQPGIQQLQCQADTSIRYALYVPAATGPDSTMPLLILLDPAARGAVPVELYKAIADQHHIILAGSNTSRNFDPNSSIQAVPAMLADIQDRYAINKGEIWLGGFSGGSRMASTYAAMDARITGVIACGAGFAQQTDNADGTEEFFMLRRSVPYAALVGDKDMNFEEMNDVAELLGTRQKQYILLPFSGGHVWPPATQMEMAVLWQSELQQTSITSKERVDTLTGRMKAQYQQYTAGGLLYFAWLTADAGRKIPSLKRIADSLVSAAEANKSFGRHKTQYTAALEEERTFMDQFSFVFNQVISSGSIHADNDALWKEKATQLINWRKDKDPYRSLSGLRAYDISWRLCSEQYGWFMETHLYKQAYSVAYILSFLDPEGHNAWYAMARAAAAMQNKDLCISNLKKAVKKHNLPKERLLSDTLILSVVDAAAIEKLY